MKPKPKTPTTATLDTYRTRCTICGRMFDNTDPGVIMHCPECAKKIGMAQKAGDS